MTHLPAIALLTVTILACGFAAWAWWKAGMEWWKALGANREEERN